MLMMWRAGYVPLLQMHDELDNSVWERRQVDELETIMKEAIPLKVPIKVDSELGGTWGDAKMTWEKCVEKYGEPERLAA
jgi:hypothetical protein